MKYAAATACFALMVSCSAPKNGYVNTDLEKKGLPSPKVQGYVEAEAPIHGANLRAKRLNKPVLEQFEKGHKPGAPPISVDITGWSPEKLLKVLQDEGGNYFSGRIRTVYWKYEGRLQVHVTAENIYWDDFYGKIIHGWQGFNYGEGYASSVWHTTIEGTEPIIKGQNYSPPQKSKMSFPF